MEPFTYRGYQVYVVSDSCAWSFVARPTTPDLPILRQPTSGLHVSRETALAEAKARIDRLLEFQAQQEAGGGLFTWWHAFTQSHNRVGLRFMGLMHHTDANREWAYDRQSDVGRLDKALDEANAKGWTVVVMKSDWDVIFPPDNPPRPWPKGDPPK